MQNLIKITYVNALILLHEDISLKIYTPSSSIHISIPFNYRGKTIMIETFKI